MPKSKTVDLKTASGITSDMSKMTIVITLLKHCILFLNEYWVYCVYIMSIILNNHTQILTFLGYYILKKLLFEYDYRV